MSQPVSAGEITPEEPKNYCNDQESWSVFERLCAQYPDDENIQTLHALRIGLCQKIDDGSISFPLAVDIFDRVHQIVIKRKIGEAKDDLDKL